MSIISVRLVAVLVLASFLPACGGRVAHPVPIIQVEDETKSCEAISAEIKKNEEDILMLQRERSRVIRGNILKTVFAGLTLGITLFRLDLKGAPQVELNAVRKRNEHLYNHIYAQKCRQQTTAQTTAPQQ